MKVMAYATRRSFDEAAKVWNISVEIGEERKKFPDRYPTPISPSYNIGDRIMRLFEGTEEQFENLAARWWPVLSWKFTFIFDSSKAPEIFKRIGQQKELAALKQPKP